MAQNTPSAANIRRYAEIVRERSVMRRLAQVGSEISDSAYTPAGRSAADLLDEAEAKVFEIAEAGARGKQGFIDIQPLLKQVVERIETLYNQDNPSDVTGIATGFPDLDQKTSGFQPGDLVIIAGRPSMGKTAFSLNIAEHVALILQKPVAVFSMEMGGSAVGYADAGLGGPPGSAQGSYRPFAGRGLVQAHPCLGQAQRCASFHRRKRGAECAGACGRGHDGFIASMANWD